jgi:hypothetical protein
MRRKKSVLPIWILGLCALLAGCGSSTKQQNQNPPTGLKKRVLVSNQQRGVINIIDAQKDVFAQKTIGASAPTRMVTAGGQTAILDSTVAQVTIFDNTKEAVTFAPLIADIPSDIVITSDGKTVWVAERNNGFVQSIDTASGVVTTSVPVPSVERLVLSPNGSKLLCFSANPQGLPGPPNTNPDIFKDAFFVIDTATANTTHQATPIRLSTGSVASGDQPFSAVFSSSETQAFILNCGSGCGGANNGTPTPPSVMSVDFTNPSAPVLGPKTPLPAATAGILLNSNLYIAGTPAGSATGTLQVVNASGLVPAGAPVAITDGLHTRLVSASNNRLFIAALNCTPGPIQPNNTLTGCLTIANVTNPTAPSVVVPLEPAFRQNFDVTGIQPISNRNIVYVVQGGELDFFDTTTDAISTSITPVDIVGLAVDAVQIDP